MKLNTLTAALICAITSASITAPAQAQTTYAGIVGKNDWLFYRYELSEPSDAAATQNSIDLIARLNKVLAANGIPMLVTMVPLKMRIYAEHLPDALTLSPYLQGSYARMHQALQTQGVHSVDLSSAFLSSPARTAANALYYRQDTHWSQSGAMLAAQTLKAAIEATPALKTALSSSPESAYNIVYGRRKIAAAGSDLVSQLPPHSTQPVPEQITPVSVVRVRAKQEALLDKRPSASISLVGSSYSADWTGFADALRYNLQRDILSISVGADQGSWVGIESYLRNEAFQSSPPSLLIWEMPERDMRAPPDYAFRDARYVSKNSDWLLRAAAWAQRQCLPAAASANIAPTGLASKTSLATSSNSDSDFVELSFSKPLQELDYLSLRLTSEGSKSLRLDAFGSAGDKHSFKVAVAGDDADHPLKTPLPKASGGVSKLRIYPGKSSKFALDAIQVCRLPEDLLR